MYNVCLKTNYDLQSKKVKRPLLWPRPVSLNMILGSAGEVSPGSLLEMQVLRSTSDLLNQKLRVGPALWFNKSPWWLWCRLKYANHWCSLVVPVWYSLTLASPDSQMAMRNLRPQPGPTKSESTCSLGDWYVLLKGSLEVEKHWSKPHTPSGAK